MNNVLIFFLILVFLNNCSLDKGTGIWTDKEKIKIEDPIIKEQFVEETALQKEFNSKLKINLTSKLIKNSFHNNFDNNNGRVDYNGSLKSISRFKFSKIKNFDQFEPEIVFDNKNVIFFNDKGSIFKFNDSSKLIWKRNYYSKVEKKIKPILFFSNNKNTLIVADNIAKYYAVNLNTGDLIWSKNNSAPFNSQVKIYKDRFFAVDSENVIKCFSIKDGSELWEVKTEKSFIKSEKKLSLIIVDNKVFFNNSIGDISAIDIKSGTILWQTPTQSSSIYEDAFFLKTSDIISDINSIYFSNNKNKFFSLNIKSGIINWEQKINSDIRPTLIENFIFSVSLEGYLIIVESKSGNIVRITDVFKKFKEKKRFKIKPVGFIVGSKNIYLTTNHGRLMIIDVQTGQTISIIKIDNEKISRPFVLDKNLFIIKENSIIKLD